MKVLLAVDRSSASQAAIDEVSVRPWPAGSPVEVINVMEPSHLWSVSETAEEGIVLSEELVSRAVAQLQTHGLEASGVSLFGHPKTVILDRAETDGADWVVVGSHGVSAVTKFLLGNVAAAVVRYAPCSVEVVRAKPGRVPGAGKRILFATDGSETAALATSSIAGRPWPEGTEVRVFSVVEFFLPRMQALFEPPFIQSEQVETLRADAMKHAQEAVTSAAGVIAAAGLKVSESVSVLLGGPKKVILEEATEWGADLIVLGSHGRHGIDRFLMGSVSEGVATHADCSVEVIRSQPQ
jgi:nucleotide-binding universal stress UspA family protein